MRLLLVIEEENLGGAELSFRELARALASRAEVHLTLSETARSRHSPVYDSLAEDQVKVHSCSRSLYAGTSSNLHRFLRRKPARELVELIGRIDPDVILVNLPTVERGQAVVDAAVRAARNPRLWGLLHLVQSPRVLGVRFGLFRDWMVGSLLRRFDRLVTVSQSGARQLSGSYGLPLPAVLHPPTPPLEPVPGESERNRRRAEHGLPHRVLLGMIGRVQLRQKGHDAALRVTAQLLRQKLPVHLVVIGDGPDLPTVRRQADKLGIAAELSLLGWRHDAATLIPLLDAVLLPSHFEGMPQTALQAASAGVPVIGYAVDGLAELLPAAFLVPPGNEIGFADTIRDLIQGVREWPREEMAQRAREWGNPGRAAEQLLELLARDA